MTLQPFGVVFCLFLYSFLNKSGKNHEICFLLVMAQEKKMEGRVDTDEDTLFFPTIGYRKHCWFVLKEVHRGH